MIIRITMNVILNLQNSHFIDFEEVFQVNGQNQPVANLPSVNFSFSAVRNAITKTTEYIIFSFLFIYWFFSSSSKV